MSLKEQIFGAEDIVRQTVQCPEWKTALVIQTLTAAEREQWEAAAYPEDGEKRVGTIRAALVCLSARDDKGNRVFEVADAPTLATKSAAVLERLYRICRRLSFVEDADVEDLAKNSEGGKASSEQGTSPSPSDNA